MAYECECVAQEIQNVGRGEAALEYQVVSGEAPHWPPVDHFVAPVGAVSEVCCGEVFYCVENRSGEGCASVGLGHADVECGEAVAAGGCVAPRNEDPSAQAVVVDSEARYFFHVQSSDCSGSSASRAESASKVCRGASSQKFSYWAMLSAAPGVSLITRRQTKGTLRRWHTWAIAALSMSTASASGYSPRMCFTSAGVLMNLSPEQTSPRLMPRTVAQGRRSTAAGGVKKRGHPAASPSSVPGPHQMSW